MNIKTVILLLYLVMVTLAELVITYRSVTLGLCIYVLLLLFLIGYSSLYVLKRQRLQDTVWEKHSLYAGILRRSYVELEGVGLFRKELSHVNLSERNFIVLLQCLALAPLIRIMSVSMPLAQLEQIHWYLLINLPLFAVIFLMMRWHSMSFKDVGLIPGRWGTQVTVALTGFSLGVMDYSFLKPAPLIVSLTPEAFIAPAVILLLFTGFSEELIFRGIIQGNAEKILGSRMGLLFASVLFTAMHIGWRSPPDLFFVFLVGVFYGLVFQKTRCLSGVTLSHGITNIMMFLVVPFLL